MEFEDIENLLSENNYINDNINDDNYNKDTPYIIKHEVLLHYK